MLSSVWLLANTSLTMKYESMQPKTFSADGVVVGVVALELQLQHELTEGVVAHELAAHIQLGELNRAVTS
eukprot:1164202-Prymnesium_polylepis.2